MSSKTDNIPKRDLISRINFLLQAGMLINRNCPPSLLPLSSLYVREAKSCAQKSLVKIDRSIKRIVCKNCNCYLIAGYTARTRVKTRRGTYFIVTCNICSHVKKAKRKVI
ncbi:hypothetical protein LOD99_7702 [Oopsacas minuta]|uniref:Uncharacterized protein n=1 Tax=Oopsacas minuta TaxID=111878 RepID=A0AAV7JP93_9METZ|nr:hypothetical protein LOD99_7702 [Oopsacas minuta]